MGGDAKEDWLLEASTRRLVVNGMVEEESYGLHYTQIPAYELKGVLRFSLGANGSVRFGLQS